MKHSAVNQYRLTALASHMVRNKAHIHLAIPTRCSGIRFTDKFKQDTVAQFVKSLGFRPEVADQAAEIRRLKRELAGMTEERTIQKRRLHTSRASLSEVDLSRFDAAPLIAFTGAKEMSYEIETDGRIPQRRGVS